MRVRSIEHGHLGVGDTLPGELHYLVGNELCFVVGAIPSEANNLVTRPHIGEQILGFAIEIVADDGISRIEDVLGGAIVLLQQHDVCTGEIPLKFRDVPNVGSAEGINRLVGVPHHGE